MTARKALADLKKAPQYDTAQKPRLKSKAKQSPEGRAKRIAALRKTPTSSTMAIVAAQNPNRPLTEKQRIFVKEWASGESILSASVRAGYSDNGTMCYRLAKDPAILKIYNLEKALYEEAGQVTRKRVMEMLIEAYDMARVIAEPSTMVAAAREVGRMAGYYEPVKRTIDINISGDVTVQKLERMSDADLVKLVKGDIEDVEFEEEAR